MPLDKAKAILTDIKNGNVKPIYFLMGEEPYYIDPNTGKQIPVSNIIQKHKD